MPLLLTSFLVGAVCPQEQYSDVQRRPNWIRPYAQFGSPGSSPGQFLGPESAAVSPDGRVFIADSGNHRIQVFSLEGKPLLSFGMFGSAPGQFRFPRGVGLAPKGDEVYVADTGNGRIQVFSAEGKFLRQWGRFGHAPEEFLEPTRVAVFGSTIAVVDRRGRRVLLTSSEGKLLKALGGFGDAPDRFREPADVVFDSQGILYVADRGNHRIQRFRQDGGTLAPWGEWGTQPGFMASPEGVAWSGDRIYLADTANHRVQVFDSRGVYLYQWGSPPVAAHEGQGHLHFPRAIAVSANGGYTVLCETLEDRCQVFSNGNAHQVVPATTEVAWWERVHSRIHGMPRATVATGNKTSRDLWERSPPVLCPALDPDDQSLLFFDIGLRPPTLVSRVGGLGGRLGQFRDPGALAIHRPSGRIFVADRGNRRVQVLELPRDPRNASGFALGPRMIAAFDPWRESSHAAEASDSPTHGVDALCVDAAGFLYVLDSARELVFVYNPGLKFVREIQIARNSAERSLGLCGLAVSPNGKTLYSLDPPQLRVLAFSDAGAPVLSWGRPGAGAGDEFLCPSAVAVDDAGSVYVADSQLNCIKKFGGEGKFLKQWGSLGHTLGKLWGPLGITLPHANRIVADDAGNHRGEFFDSEGVVLDAFVKGGGF